MSTSSVLTHPKVHFALDRLRVAPPSAKEINQESSIPHSQTSPQYLKYGQTYA